MKQLKKLACRAVQELSITFPPKTVLSIILGTAITTFGIYNIHQQADITEGGILGLILLFHFWFGMSSSILSPVLDALSYALGFRFLGKEFLKTSIFATICWPDSSGSGNCFPRYFQVWLTTPFWRLWQADASSVPDAAWWSARELPAPGTTPWPWSSPRLRAAAYPGHTC